MTESSQPRTDRISPKGTVLLLADDQVERARVVNISRTGLLAATSTPLPAVFLGKRVAIELRLDGARSEWLRLGGQIVRVDGDTVAVALEDVSEAYLQLIDESSTASYRHRRVVSVVLVDAVVHRRLRLAEAFRAAGCTVIDVATPLEAIVRLGEAAFEPDVVAIADSAPTAIADELRRFVERDHPRASLVTITDEVTRPDGLELWLSALGGAPELRVQIRDLLTAGRSGSFRKV